MSKTGFSQSYHNAGYLEMRDSIWWFCYQRCLCFFAL